jgi:hypothetical protein
MVYRNVHAPAVAPVTSTAAANGDNQGAGGSGSPPRQKNTQPDDSREDLKQRAKDALDNAKLSDSGRANWKNNVNVDLSKLDQCPAQDPCTEQEGKLNDDINALKRLSQPQTTGSHGSSKKKAKDTGGPQGT